MPPTNVLFTNRAASDLQRIFIHLIMYSFYEQEYAEQAARIIDQLELLAISPVLGVRLKGQQRSYRYWPIVNELYRVYYERLDPEHIMVVHIRWTKQNPKRDAEIEGFITETS